MLLPFDLILTVGAASAVFVLGVTVWWRRKWAIGGMLFALMAISLATWTSADWIVSLQSSALPDQILGWKLLFYLTVALGPALAMHISAIIARRSFARSGVLVYGAGVAAFVGIASGFILRAMQIPGAELFLTGGAFFGLILYVSAFFSIAIHLYPLTMAPSIGTLNHRRAIYGIIILFPYLVAGGMQLVVGSIPTSFFLPLLAIFFLVFSLLAFIRASFLDVEFGPLEAFFLFLTAFAVVLLLRSRSVAETTYIGLGSVIVGAFALLAISTVQSERNKRVLLEESNRQLRRLDEARTDFLNMVSHQLRSPLGGIRGSTSMLAAGDYGPLPPKVRDAVLLIQDAATRLLSMADSFLNAARIEVGKYESSQVATNVGSEIAQVVTEMTSFARSKKLGLSTRVSPGVPSSVRLDVEVLRNALFNLIDNAIKYTERGSVEVRCTRDDGFIVIEVRDTGIGTSPEELADLFKKFHRSKNGKLHERDGTGLGLFVVKELVEAADGRIFATSEGRGKGSTFTFRLPFEAV